MAWIRLRRMVHDANEYRDIEGTREEVDKEFLELVPQGWTPWVWSEDKRTMPPLKDL